MDEVGELLASCKISKGIKVAVEALLGQSQEASKTHSLRLLWCCSFQSESEVGEASSYVQASF
ncbi:hypothetical protein Taro_019599 [Colocasia esculenta]|uniref:Uncharacterized protein n=1 Tax=Colocasia esculenta TaxID=4460 RepID=A0A843UZS8_COLES|nr:hypothetical protein [Colocasia esculenta]